jgi:hypothetical protein
VNEDRGVGALPKLYGAPAYGRPPVPVPNAVDRPFDPDNLPLEAARTDEDEPRTPELQPRSYDSVATAEPAPVAQQGSPRLHGRAFRLRLPGHGKDGR